MPLSIETSIILDKMESWLEDMKYFGTSLSEDAKLQMELNKCLSMPHTKKVWKHIFTHIRPKEECKCIKKQCLLPRIKTASVDLEHFQLKCLKDFDLCMKKRREELKFKKIKQQIEEKKSNISENVCRLQLKRKFLLKDEELLNECVYKLDHLKKKRKTVERSNHKFEKNTKILKILHTSPNRFVDYGSNVTNWERKVLLFVEELLAGFELEIIISKMEEQAKDSQLSAVSKWDRSEILTEMEKTLLAKLKLQKHVELNLEELNEKYMEKECNMFQFSRNYLDDFCLIINFMEDIQNDSLKNRRALVNIKPPYLLQSEQFKTRRLNKLIETKAKDLHKFLLEDQDFSSLYISSQPFEISLSEELAFEKIKNSVAKEIRSFMALSLCQESPEYIVDYIQPCFSSSSELNFFKQERNIHLKVIQLVEKICNINLPTFDAKSTSNELDTKFIPILSNLSDKITEIKREELLSEDIYKRVKDAFFFLYKEPLNEKLVGMEIEGKEINYWLNRYANSKRKHDHELWILNNNTH